MRTTSRFSNFRASRAALMVLAMCGCDATEEPDGASATVDTLAAQAPQQPSTRTPGGKAEFPPGLCDDVYEFRFHGPGGPGTDFMVQPGGESHPTVQFDAPWGDETVQAVAYWPLIDNTKVTHHYILAAGTMGWLDSWAPGNEDPPLPDDVGMELPKGKNALALNMHYYNLAQTTAEPDQSGLAVCVVRGAHLRKKVGAVHPFAAVKFPMVPANTKGHVLTGSCKATTKEPVQVFTLAPHMHLLGRHATLTVTKPDGTTRTLHDGSFNFTEQVAIPLDPPWVIENGDTVTVSCTYDNESNRAVQFGEDSTTEMCFNFITYAPKGALNCGAFGALTTGGLSFTAGLPGAAGFAGAGR